MATPSATTTPAAATGWTTGPGGLPGLWRRGHLRTTPSAHRAHATALAIT